MGRNAQAVELSKELWDFVRMMSHSLNTVYTPITEVHGLSALQARILMMINECGSTTVGCVGDAMGVTSGNTSTTCKKLEKAGFIKRVRDPEDERYVKLVLTDQGQQAIKCINETFIQLYGPILETTTNEDYETMIAGMRRIRRLIAELDEISERT